LKSNFINITFFFSSLNTGCQKNGDDVENIHTIAHVINQSSESTPEWEEYENQLQYPRTDCGYFQLGKNKKVTIY